MNAVEIEQAISDLAAQSFDAQEFPFAFLQAFGNKETTLKRLRKGESNKSDIGGVLQTNNIHIAVAPRGEVTKTLQMLRASPATTKGKAKFILATDGDAFEAEDVASGETVACAYADFPNHFGFFLPLAGITTVQQVRENAFDIRATSRLNRLYIELLKDNPDWGTAARRPDMNHFMARLIFCFFAEDTDIFNGEGLFTATIDQMSARDSSNTHEVIAEIFRAMNTAIAERASAKLPRWADQFPYVNGGLFSGDLSVPRFSKIARSYLLHIGGLNWRLINPDIFGSMIQAVADDEERGALGMHYTSVPNILKVLDPLFLDELRAKLAEAGDNARALLNLRKRMSRIRVFDPACGSGNFLVIAYKEMRKIEAEINKRRGEPERQSDIPLTNFRGIELRDFPAEIARLALIIAEYQCDVLYRGQKDAIQDFLPLDAENWITCGNALRLDWLLICPPTGVTAKIQGDDLFNTPLDQAQIDFENEGGETYICGNPPYLGSRGQDRNQKADLETAVAKKINGWRGLDFVSGWIVKAAEYTDYIGTKFAFVTTNSICQGQQVASLWGWLLGLKLKIEFAYSSFKWTNLAAHNAGVTVIIVGLAQQSTRRPLLYVANDDGSETSRIVENINPYLVPGPNVLVNAQANGSIIGVSLERGSAPTDDGAYSIDDDTVRSLAIQKPNLMKAILRAYGAKEFASGEVRWILKPDLLSATDIQSEHFVAERVMRVRKAREGSVKEATRRASMIPESYTEDRYKPGACIFVPQIIAEGREYITPGLLPDGSLVLAPHFHASADTIIPVSILASRLHLVWIATVCGKLETRYRYSNTLGWNTFPVPTLTDQNKADLARCAEDILLAREAHFPATIADLYDPDMMPADLREAHARNDETVERIYIGRRFRNDTERLEKLFEMYAKMTAAPSFAAKRKAGKRK